jgi:hypothetical protein
MVGYFIFQAWELHAAGSTDGVVRRELSRPTTYDYKSKKPRRKAIVTAWVRSLAPNLSRMLRM